RCPRATSECPAPEGSNGTDPELSASTPPRPPDSAGPRRGAGHAAKLRGHAAETDAGLPAKRYVRYVTPRGAALAVSRAGAMLAGHEPPRLDNEQARHGETPDSALV